MERLPDKLDSNARVEVRVNGEVVGTRRIIDFLGEIVGVEDALNDKVTLTIVSTDDEGNPIVSYWKVEDEILQPDVAQTGDITNAVLTTDIDSNTYVSAGDSGVTVSGEDHVNLVTVGGEIILNTNGGTITFQDPLIDTLLADTGVSPGTYGGAGVDMEIVVNAKGRITAITNSAATVASQFWKYLSGTLQNDTALTPGINDINLAPQGLSGDTYVELFDGGTGDGFININSEQGSGDINVAASRDWNQTNGNDVNIGAGNDVNVSASNELNLRADNDVKLRSIDGGNVEVSTDDGAGGGGDILVQTTGGGVTVSALAGDIELDVSNGSGAVYLASGAGNVELLAQGGDIKAEVNPGSNIVFTGLPTSSAGLPSGALWNDTGDLKIVP